MLEIPLIDEMGIKSREERRLTLDSTPRVHNPFQSIHAAAQFALAETQSGLFLQNLFPEYKGEVMPLLRGATVKYKHQATSTIEAIAKVDDEKKEKFMRQFNRKGRASITVDMTVIDEAFIVTMEGTFTWFIQKR